MFQKRVVGALLCGAWVSGCGGLDTGAGGDMRSREDSLAQASREVGTQSCAPAPPLASLPFEGFTHERIPSWLCQASPDSCLSLLVEPKRTDQPRPSHIQVVATDSGFELRHDAALRPTSVSTSRGRSGFTSAFDSCGRLISLEITDWPYSTLSQGWEYEQTTGRLLRYSSRSEQGTRSTGVRSHFLYSATGALEHARVETQVEGAASTSELLTYTLDEQQRIRSVRGEDGREVEERRYPSSSVGDMTLIRGDEERTYAQGRRVQYVATNVDKRYQYASSGSLLKEEAVENGVGGDGYTDEYAYGSDGRLESYRHLSAAWSETRYRYDDAGVLRGSVTRGNSVVGEPFAWETSYLYE